MPAHRTDLSCAQKAEQVMRDPKSLAKQPKGLDQISLEANQRLASLELKVYVLDSDFN